MGAAAELPANYLELYKLAVEMADRISARRGTANSFFLTVNTGLAALLGSTELRWYVAVAGVLCSLSWWALLKSYRDLNKAKFAVILAMEEQLPVRVYSGEKEHLATGRYWELGSIERFVPWTFVLIYVAELLRQLLS
jgi:hypothetical protein